MGRCPRGYENREEKHLRLDGWVWSGGLSIGGHTRAASKRTMLAALGLLVSSLRAGTTSTLLTVAFSTRGTFLGSQKKVNGGCCEF